MSEAKKLGWDVTSSAPRDQRALSPHLGKESGRRPLRGFWLRIPYEDTAKGKVKDWLANYKKMFGTDAYPAIIG